MLCATFDLQLDNFINSQSKNQILLGLWPFLYKNSEKKAIETEYCIILHSWFY